jgi:hypothetical protein
VDAAEVMAALPDLEAEPPPSILLGATPKTIPENKTFRERNSRSAKFLRIWWERIGRG